MQIRDYLALATDTDLMSLSYDLHNRAKAAPAYKAERMRALSGIYAGEALARTHDAFGSHDTARILRADCEAAIRKLEA